MAADVEERRFHLLATRSPTIGPVADPSFPSACVVQPSKMSAAAEASHATCGLLLSCQERIRRGRLGSVTQPLGAAKRLSVQGDQVAPGWRRPVFRPRVIGLELVTVLRSAGLDL